jgi:hypothetical protein
MRGLMERMLGRVPALVMGEPKAAPEPKSSAKEMVEALQQIAQRYRHLQANSSSAEARDTFGAMAAEYEARADRIEAERS